MKILALLILSSPVNAADSKSILAFRRCYGKLTRKALPANHPLLPRIRSGDLSPVDACFAVLQSAQLKTSTEGGTPIVEGADSITRSDAYAVLKTFNDFHRTWFQSDDIITPMPGSTCTGASRLVHDEGEPALHITRALLSKDVPYSEVLTGRSSMMALRSDGPRSGPIHVNIHGDTIVGPFVQSGELLGIRRVVDDPTLQSFQLTNNHVGDDYYNGLMNSGSAPRTVTIHESYGGGIIGTPSYLMMNFGRALYSPSDGGKVMQRRWSRAVYGDLLCRNLPVVRLVDATKWVVHQPSTQGAAQPPFRGGSTCMQCHSSLDGMAGAARNLSPLPTPDENDCGELKAAAVFTKWKVELGRGAEFLPARDLDYARRPPDGRIYLRDYTGRLINQTVTDLDGLGQALAQMDDPYICAASRYYYLLTGKTVSIDDPGHDGSAAVQNALDLQAVIALGKRLHQSQSLALLVKDILQTTGGQL